MDEEGEEDLLESDLEGEGMTGGTSAGAGGEHRWQSRAQAWVPCSAV